MMKKTIVFIGLLAMLLAYACQKETSIHEAPSLTAPSSANRAYFSQEESNFFAPEFTRQLISKTSPSASSRSTPDPFIQAIDEYLYQRNQQTNFVHAFIERAGYPVWEAASVSNTGATQYGLIPLIQEARDTVQTILYVRKKGDDWAMKLFDRSYVADAHSRHPDDVNLESWQADFDRFNHLLFNHSESQLVGDKASPRSCTSCTGCIKEGSDCYKYEYGQYCDCARDCPACKEETEEEEPSGGTSSIFDILWKHGFIRLSGGGGNGGDLEGNSGYFPTWERQEGEERSRGGARGFGEQRPCSPPFDPSNEQPGDGTIFDLLEDLAAQKEVAVKQAVEALYHAIGLNRSEWRWLLANPGAAIRMQQHLEAHGNTAETQAILDHYFDRISQFPCLLLTDLNVAETLSLDGDHIGCVQSGGMASRYALHSTLMSTLTNAMGSMGCENLSWLLDNLDVLQLLGDLIGTKASLTEDEKAAIQLILHSLRNDQMDQVLEGDLDAVAQSLWPPTYASTAGDLAGVLGEYVYLKKLHENDGWPDWKLYATAVWNIYSDRAHTLLDLCGFVLEPCDGVNAVFYLIEGDGKNAAISAAALLPIAGWWATGGRVVKRIIGISGRGIDLKFITDATGFITFGRSGQLATVIGSRANHQAHHIIPWQWNNHAAIQMAAQKGWHPNEALNGISLSTTIHKGSHPIYSAAVQSKLNELNVFVQAGNDEIVLQKLITLADEIRSIINSTSFHINDPQLALMIRNIVL